MTRNSKILAAFLATIVGVSGASEPIYNLIWGKVVRQREQLAVVERQLQAKQLELRKSQVACERFEEQQKRSLHAEPSKAQLAYQEYLVRLTSQCDLKSVVISSGQPERVEGVGHKLHFSVQGEGMTRDIGKLIDGIYRTDVLHRVSHLNVFQSRGPNSSTHSFAMDVEVMNLRGVRSNENAIVATPPSKELQSVFSGRDFFRREATKPAFTVASSGSPFTVRSSKPPAPKPTAKPKPIPKPRIDKKTQVRFVGILQGNDRATAVFLDTSNGREQSLREEDTLKPMGLQAKIIRIERDQVVLQEEDRLLHLPLGKTISAAETRTTY